MPVPAALPLPGRTQVDGRALPRLARISFLLPGPLAWPIQPCETH